MSEDKPNTPGRGIARRFKPTAISIPPPENEETPSTADGQPEPRIQRITMMDIQTPLTTAPPQVLQLPEGQRAATMIQPIPSTVGTDEIRSRFMGRGYDRKQIAKAKVANIAESQQSEPSVSAE